MKWHIFCRVIDNFGDIGVCWRLASRLHRRYGQQVHLWLDDLDALRALCPKTAHANHQWLHGIRVHRWQQPFKPLRELRHAEVVVEAFGCELPDTLLHQMRQSQPQPVWINLEYLSAEPWVDQLHGLPSPVQGMHKTFFFPGFTARTGGLLADETLYGLPGQLQQTGPRRRLFRQLGIDPELAGLALHISLFSYENSRLPELLDSLCSSPRPVHLCVPQGRISQAVAGWLGQPLQAGCSDRRASLYLSAVPFMAQPDYDRLLASCQLNFVRGEESFVRAQMLGLPLVWHIYPQDDHAHHDKLDAFLQRYLQDYPVKLKQPLRAAFMAWNRSDAPPADWLALLDMLPRWQACASDWRRQLLAHGDLAGNLLEHARQQRLARL